MFENNIYTKLNTHIGSIFTMHIGANKSHAFKLKIQHQC